MITRRTFLAGSAGAASLAALGSRASAQAPGVLRFGPTTTDISIGHAAHSSLPRALGFWEKEGLNVEIFGVAGPQVGLQMVTSNQMEFVTITAEELLFGRSQGMKVKTGYMHSREPIARIVTLKDAGYSNLSSVKGKTVGTPQLQTNPLADGIFAEAGIDLTKDVTMVATGTGAPAALALRRGDIVAWSAWDTAVAGLQNLGLEFETHYPSYWDQLLGNFIVGTEEMIDGNPETYVKLCRGVAKAVHFGLTNPEAAIRLHWELYPQTRPQGDVTPEAMEAAKRTFMSRFSGYELKNAKQYGEASLDQWGRVAKQMADAGVLQPNYDLTTAYDAKFLDQINDFDRKEIEDMAKNWKQ